MAFTIALLSKRLTLLCTLALTYLICTRTHTPTTLIQHDTTDITDTMRVGPSFVRVFISLYAVEIVVWVAWRVFLFPNYFSPLRHFPEPAGNHWLHGQWRRISKEPAGYPQTEWINTIPNDGIIRYRSLFNIDRIMVTTHKALSEVLTTKAYDWVKPAFFRNGLGKLLGVGILLADGEEHKAQRRNLSPAFAFRHVKNLTPLFWEKSRESVLAVTKHLEDAAARRDPEKTTATDASIIEANEWASRATLDIIGVAGMGVDFGAIQNPDTPLSKTYRDVFQPSGAQRLLIFLNLFFPNWLVQRIPIERNRQVARASTFIRSTVRNLIQAKKRAIQQNKAQHDLDILSVAIESGGFEDENLVDQMMTFLAAGHETTASALTWAVYLLCRHPEWQDRLRDEVHTHLPSLTASDDGKPLPITSNDLDKLTYLHAFCNEVLRYFAPVPLTTRVAARDTTIDGHAIPKGTGIFLVIRAINMSEAMWGEDAATFRPERWLQPRESAHHALRDREPQAGHTSPSAQSPYAMLTFLHGPRSCIGQGFAKAEFACLLAAWVGRLSFRIRDEELLDERKLDVKGAVTTKPAGGLWVKVDVVEGW